MKRWERQGYWFIYVRKGHAFISPGDMGEHRFIMCEKLGRLLDKDEVVHHIDGDRFNNDPNNLEILTRAEHASHHIKGKPKSAAHKAKMSAQMMGNQIHKGHRHSPEAKAKMSKAHIGKTLSEEHKAKLRGHTFNRGRVHTPEARARMGRSPPYLFWGLS